MNLVLPLLQAEHHNSRLDWGNKTENSLFTWFNFLPPYPTLLGSLHLHILHTELQVQQRLQP